LSEVHDQIAKQVEEMQKAIASFKRMDQKREEIISQLVERFHQGEKIDLTPLNDWTKEMNQFAAQYHLPIRKYVTMEMFESYAKKL